MKRNYFGNNKNANVLRVTDTLYADNVPCRVSVERYSSRANWLNNGEEEEQKKYKNVMPIKHKNLERASNREKETEKTRNRGSAAWRRRRTKPT